MNEFLFFLSIFASFSLVYVCYLLFGKNGLFSWIAFAVVFANIEVLKTINCFGLETTLGNALFGTVFLATDIISEKYGEKDAKKAVMIGFFISFAFIVTSQLDIVFIPSKQDFASDSFSLIFKLTPRVCIASVIAYLIGNRLDVFLYNKMKNKHGESKMWLRNNLCTLVSQLLDNYVFYFIAFYGVMETKRIAIICINVWIMEAIAAVCDTPFLYLAKKADSAIHQ